MAGFITTLKEVRELTEKVNSELHALNRVYRLRVDSEDGQLFIRYGLFSQINNGTCESGYGSFRQPKQAYQFLEGFLAGLRQPQWILNPNYKLACTVCEWRGTFDELGESEALSCKTCPDCESHKLLGI